MMTGFVVIFAVVSLLVVAVFVAVAVAIFRGARARTGAGAGPEVTAVAAIVDKRIETSGGGESSVWQHHFVSFEQPDGTRFELEVPAGEYGLLVVGDRGSVTMRGTQYRGFSREIMR